MAGRPRRPWPGTPRGALALVFALALGLGGCGGDGDDGAARGDAARDTLRINIGSEPPSLDPAILTDTISGNLLLNVMDPLVKLDEDLEPEPALAERWDVSDDGLTVTYHLRDDGAWTNGDPVTAHDFEYAWKRVLDPELAAGYAYQFFGIRGAAEYTSCKESCDAARDDVAITAVDDRTLEVGLTSPQPWFVAQTAHASFLPVHRKTVERHGRQWTEPANTVTNGPYRLTAWRHDDSLTLERWDDWRSAEDVAVRRIEVKMITDATTALQAFEAGELDACLENSCIPPGEIERLKESDEFFSGPLLATQYFGVNVKNVPDVNQRRALALALDRRDLVENVTKAGETPATSFTPQGMPGFETITPDFLPERPDLDAARGLLERATAPKRSIALFYPSAGPGLKDVAVATQAAWKALGVETDVRAMEWAQFLEFLGPPASDQLDVFLIGWVADFVDDINFLELWTCESGNNPTGFCDKRYDALVEEARRTPDDADRHELYRQAEAILTGPEGQFPIIPAYWSVNTTLAKAHVEGWEPNALDQYDFTDVALGD